MVITFDKNERDYVGWFRANPDGYTVNEGRTVEYHMMHRADCYTITVYDTPFSNPKKKVNRREFGCYTEESYIKVCAETKQELEDHYTQRGIKLQYCSKCRI
jgi:hypothetical protein